jgi:nucleotide-binding universal stress UspA family protein
MKILLAVDGSKSSLHAVDNLIAHADWYRDRPTVELVTVHLPVPHLPGLSKVVSKARFREYYVQEGEAQLAAAKTMLDNAGIDYEARILVGSVAEILVAHAKAKRCDMIVVGSRGLGAAGSMLLGSTTTKVLHLSSVPVLVVR